jgi:hypothetical protein
MQNFIERAVTKLGASLVFGCERPDPFSGLAAGTVTHSLATIAVFAVTPM